ncbi:MAG: hypothetical protein KKB59_10635 [Spirochaetes bacterium]|nr:hypothetical protein [Spirochaetota bacterium]
MSIIHAEDQFKRANPIQEFAVTAASAILQELDRAIAQRIEPASPAAPPLPAGVTKTGAAGAAQAIRAELRAAYPGIKFSVTSERFAGGDSVSIHWTDGPLTREVEQIVSRYEMGHFDGMTDMYEYDNRDPNLPQAKYVSAERSHSPEAKARARSEIEEHYGIDLSDERAIRDKFNQWPDSMIRSRLEQTGNYF